MARERNKPVSFRDIDASDWSRVKLYDWVELKYDGHFARINIEHRHWRLYSSTGRLVERVELSATHKCSTTLWAEHIRGTEWARRPQHADLYDRLAVFASPLVDGKLQPFPHSAVTRRAIARWLKHHTAAPFDRLFLVGRDDASEARALWKQHVKGGDYEGLILGGAQGLARMKAQATYDYVCMGFEPSDADKYVGWGVRNVIGGLYVNGELQRVTRVGGLTDDQRAAFFQNPTGYVGQVFEAEGKKLFDTGKLRHPNFLRWRTDKKATACKLPER